MSGVEKLGRRYRSRLRARLHKMATEGDESPAVASIVTSQRLAWVKGTREFDFVPRPPRPRAKGEFETPVGHLLGVYPSSGRREGGSEEDGWIRIIDLVSEMPKTRAIRVMARDLGPPISPTRADVRLPHSRSLWPLSCEECGARFSAVHRDRRYCDACNTPAAKKRRQRMSPKPPSMVKPEGGDDSTPRPSQRTTTESADPAAAVRRASDHHRPRRPSTRRRPVKVSPQT